MPIGFLPGGGTSVLSRALGMPADPVHAARRLAVSIKAAARRRITVGRVNGRRFAFAAGVGLDAEAVRRVDRMGRTDEGKRPGDLAFALAVVRSLGSRGGHIEPGLEVKGFGRAAFAFVANGSPYTYVKRLPLPIASEAQFELGLDLVAPVRVRRRTLLPTALSILSGHVRGRRDTLYGHDLDRVEIVCDRPTALQADGEDLGDVEEAVFEAERGAVSVFVVVPTRLPPMAQVAQGEPEMRRVIDEDRELDGVGRTGAARPLPLDGAAADVRRAFARVPPAGPHRDVRDLLEPRGDAGRLGVRARGRGLDLPELSRVGDRTAARNAAVDGAAAGGAAIRRAGGIPPTTTSRPSASRSRRTCRTPSASRGARS